MQQDVIGLESGIRFEFPAPVAFFILLGKQNLTGPGDSRGGTPRKVVDLSETQLGSK